MSGRIRAGSARVTLANLTPAHKSQHSVRLAHPSRILPTLISLVFSSKNVLVAVKVHTTEEPLDGVPMVKIRGPEAKLSQGLRVDRRLYPRGSRREVL